MVSTEYTNAWIDRYLRNELTAEDETRFENALLDSPQLQDELEATLAMRRVLQLEERFRAEDPGAEDLAGDLHVPWIPIALTASVILAVLSSVMYWNVSHEVAGLRTGIEQLNKAHPHEVMVPLDVMRSASADLPEAIIHKPDDGASVVFDIELTPAAVRAGTLQMTLRGPAGDELASWHAVDIREARVQATLQSGSLPDGRVWLEIADENGRILDRRLIEFR